MYHKVFRLALGLVITIVPLTRPKLNGKSHRTPRWRQLHLTQDYGTVYYAIMVER